jgi:anthranilate 1,2-dioxygenase small subunit
VTSDQSPVAYLIADNLITDHLRARRLHRRALSAKASSAAATMDTRDLRFEIDDLYADYAECLDDGELERWPGFFTDVCLYKIIPRENFERGLPLALMLCESKGMCRDRVEALRRASVYAPRALRHVVSNIRLKGEDAAGMRVQANYVVLQTLTDEPTQVFNAGKYIDRIVRQAGQLKFAEKLCVFDSVVVPGSLVYPV